MTTRSRKHGRRQQHHDHSPGMLEVLGQWRVLRWFLVLMVPQVSAGVALGIRSREPLWAIMMILVGGVLASLVVVGLARGVTFPNGRTYTRARTPIRYWGSMMVLCLGYLGIVAAGLFAPIAGVAVGQ